MLTTHIIWRYRYTWKIYYSGCLSNTVWSDDTVTVSVLVWWWAFVNVAVKLEVSEPQTNHMHCTFVQQLLRDED